MKKEEFFIGWKNELPKHTKKVISKLLIVAFFVMGALVFIFTKFTHPFNNHIFEVFNVKEFTGTYYNDPFPVLILDEGQSPIEGENHAMLVGYGKNGAETFIPADSDLMGKKVKIAGTLIYGDNRVLIELTKKEKSILEVMGPVDKGKSENFGSKLLQGEIVDPKCWFGVMKPAEGKVHKSCAIRCISGGIPPVLRVKNEDGFDYYILKGEDGIKINKDQHLLSFVGEQSIVNGNHIKANGWDILYIDPRQIRGID